MGPSLVLNRRPKVPAEDTAAFGAIAERFRRAGALEQAVSLCREGLQKFPDHVSARVTLGWSLLDLGKYDDARLELEQVMRRAPDNLAAIRGLAELHDRFEHTLNLPMDGPGQWPPPADSVELENEAGVPAPLEARDEPLAEGAEEFESGASFVETPEVAALSMAPPEMGLPLWTPEPAASTIAEAVPSDPVTAAGTGMSSVREIDAFAGAPIPAQAAATQPVRESAAIDMAAEDVDLGVIDETLAALLAEADSLDAAADFQIQTSSGLENADVAEPGQAIELEASDFQSVELAAVEVDAASLAATPDAVRFEDVPAPVVVEAVPEEVVEAVMSPVALEAAEHVGATSPVVMEALQHEEVETTPVAMEIEQIDESVVAIARAEAPAPELDLAPAAVDVVLLEAPSRQVDVQAIDEIDEAERTAEVIAFASRPPSASQPAVREPVELLPDERMVIEPVAAPRKGAAAVVALERMLARVHARRLQLMAESVA